MASDPAHRRRAALHAMKGFAYRWRLRFEPVITPLFRAWWRFRRPMTLGVRGVACDEQGRVLLIRHTYMQGWHFPGGGVEHGETALEAIVREMAEEAGVLALGAPKLIGLYANHANFPNDHIALYLFDAWSQGAATQVNEIAESRFFAFDALPADVSRATRRRVAELFEGADISPHW